jgi:hypothetical protein
LLAVLIFLSLATSDTGAWAACLDVSQIRSFEGELTFRIFGGPPYNGGVRLGDTPEPSYILILEEPICVSGDDFLEQSEQIDQIQIYPDEYGGQSSALSKDLRRLVGQRVRVEGKGAFGRHTQGITTLRFCFRSQEWRGLQIR